MRKHLLIFICLVQVVFIQAANRYWVGGTGAWNSSSHWSGTSGGLGGMPIPTMNDDVFFDQNSFSTDKEVVMITVNASCRSIDWTNINHKAVFSCRITKSLTVYGSYKLSPLLIFGFKGQTIFAASSLNNDILTAGKRIVGNWVFNGSGSWLLQDDVLTDNLISINLIKGSLNTNNKKVTCGYFNGNSTLTRSLLLTNSDIRVKQVWDFSSPASLLFDPGTSTIIFSDTISHDNFKDGGLRYANVSTVAALGTNTATCVFPQFTVTLTADSVTCNSLCDGSAHVIVTGGSGAPVYDWNFAATPAGDGTANITGLCASTNTVKVTEIIAGVTVIHFCSVSVGEPPPLNDFEASSTDPLCFGNCNGFIAVDETGGTPPYTFSWTGGLGTNDTAINVCAGTYTATVTDSRGCTDASAVVTLIAPVLLIAPGSSTNVSCFGACDGTASVVVSGGTLPYSYNWTPGAPPGDGTANITGLCPGAYTCTVTDAHGCIATYSTVITQPPILTLALTHTNTSCFGICDGTATATVSGGTPPYLYSWSNGSITSTASTTNTVSSLCAGIITVTITDANGCTISNSVTITQPAALVATATGVNVTCFGLCNGTATVGVVGGTPAFSYSWVGPAGFTAATASISALCPGVYTVTVTDSHGCTSPSSVTITEPPVLSANPIGTNVTCFGLCNGSATATPTGGTGPYTYNWTPGVLAGNGTPTITSLCPGTYNVTVTDSKGCTSVQSVVITQPTVINTGLTFTNVTCNLACNGTATSTPSGGVGPYTFLWVPGGATTATISGLCPGVYTVTVTDANGCTKPGSVTITQPNLLTVSIASTVLLCNGDCNATATATIAGGTPPYTIDWLPGSPIGDGTTTISSLCAGTYTVNITDANGCLATATVTINQPPALNILGATTNVSCFGVCNGTAAVIGGGGTPAYTFSWAPGGQITSSITLQCAGSYTVTLTDANGCNIKDTLAITQPSQLFGNPSVVSNVSCSGVCDGSATSAPAGGTPPYVYDWTPGLPVGDGTPTITALCAGVYNLTVTDFNLCTSTMPVTITQPLVLSAPITGSTSSCNVCNGTATCTPAGGTGPYTYLWLPTGQTTAIATGLCPNITYTVTVTDAHGCTATSTVTILQSIIITITTSNTTLSCFGACDGTATASPAGGTIPYSYIWTGPMCGGAVGIVSLTQTAVGLGAGTYTVSVSDASGCFNTDTVVFVNPPLLTVSTTHTDLTCGGVCTGTGTATPLGGTGADTYLWMPGGQTTQTATALCAGTYTVTVTDASGCTAIDSVIITTPSIVIDNVTITSANCLIANGVISVAPTGGAGAGSYTYNWGPGAPTGDGTPTITNLIPGAYTLVITSGGCVFNFNYLLGNIAGPTLVMSHTDVSCNNVCDGTATVVASAGVPGYTYSWSPGAAVTSTINSLCGTTTYVVTVTDAAGCVNLGSATVINPILISPNPTIVNESCGGSCNGSISLAPTGGTPGYSYLWSTGAVTSSISGLCAAGSPYSVTVTDSKGCDSVLVINITSPPTLIVTLTSTNVLCNGACNGTASATVVGGTAPFTYAWSHGGAFVLPNVIGLCPGPYTVTVTDANGCTASATVIITEPVALTTSTSQTNVSCNLVCDGTATVIPAGGTIPYTYSWLPGGQITSTAIALCAGSYNATVTDANGCFSVTPSVTITQPTAIIPTATFTNPTCNSACNGTVTSAPTGGTGPYTFLWMPGAFVTASVNSLCAGIYTITVTDFKGCSNTQNVTLTDPLTLSANTTSNAPTCSNSCNGSVISNPVGGTGAGTYTYSWAPGGAVTQSVAGLCPGVYTVIVNDANACADTQAITVINPLPIDIAIGSTPASCGACDGSFNIAPVSGTPPFTYVWTIGGVVPPLPFAGNGTPNVTNVCAGIYSVLVTDLNGCDSTFTIPMNNSGGPTGETENITNATCNGTCNGSASVTPIGGIAPYTYLWNDGPPATAIDTAFGLCAGNYLVEVTDAGGCIHFSPVTITQPAPILSNGIITSALCSNVCTGNIIVAPSGGTPGYTYFWAPGVITGQGTPNVTGLCPGTYTLTITDANSCTKIDSFVVGQSAALTVAIASTNISCAAVCNGTAYITITSGTAPFTIQWNDPAGQTNDTATALCAGNYSVNVTDANGCTVTLNTTIISAPALIPNTTVTNASCGLCDGTATLAPTGGTAGYTYLWSGGAAPLAALNTSLCAGLYTVNITDAAGCVTNVSVPISNSGGPTSAAIASTNVTCNGLCNGTVTAVTPAGGTAPYTFLWIASGSIIPTQAGLCAGTYFVQITDAHGCSLMDSVVITQPAPILANQVVTAATCGACDGAITIAPSGCAGPVPTILWNTGATTPTISSLCAGVYSVQITCASGCTQNVIIPVNSQGGSTLVTSSTNVSCNGSCNGTATVVASGGVLPYAYLWNDVALQTTSVTTPTLCAGTYFVQVTNGAGCITIASTIVTQPSPLGFSVAHAINPLCNGNSNGSITTIPSGGTLSYTYAWTPAPAFPQTTAIASGLNANTYIVTLTDGNGCTATQTVTLINPVSLTISDIATPSSCNTTPDGAINVTVGGGTIPYVYQWSGGSVATTQDLAGILSGSYTITVTDSNSCAIADTIILAANATVIAAAGKDTSFCQSGALTLSAAGSINGVNYQWFQMPGNTSVGNTSIVSVNPPSGVTSYYVSVNNGAGCSDNDTIVVTSNALPSVNAGPDVTIVLGASTPIGGSPTTGMAGATIHWTPTPGALDNSTISNPTATPNTTTTYTVTVTSPQGCSASDSMIVTVRPTIVFPDGISPNGDGANDEWIIDGIELFPNCTVEVYNRWGELLFQSLGYKEHWKGLYKNQPLPVGTYYYIIDLKDPLFPKAYTGPITIMR